MDVEDTIVLTDEEGHEHEFAVLDMLEVGEGRYAILLPLGEDAEEEEDEAIILKVEADEKGEEVLVEIEDDAEWDTVARAWEESVWEEDGEEDK